MRNNAVNKTVSAINTECLNNHQRFSGFKIFVDLNSIIKYF